MIIYQLQNPRGAITEAKLFVSGGYTRAYWDDVNGPKSQNCKSFASAKSWFSNNILEGKNEWKIIDRGVDTQRGVKTKTIAASLTFCENSFVTMLKT